MRMPALKEVAEVCCVWIPVLSLSSIRMSPGFMLPFSSSSSPEITSVRVGVLPMVRLMRVEVTTTSSSSCSCPSCSSISTSVMTPSGCGTRTSSSFSSSPTWVILTLYSPAGRSVNWMTPALSATAVRLIDAISAVAPASGCLSSAVLTDSLIVCWASARKAQSIAAQNRIVFFMSMES